MPYSFSVMIGKSRKDTSWKHELVPWDWFVENLSKPERQRMTQAEYLAMKPEEQAELKDVGGYVPGRISGGNRKKSNVNYRTALTLDADAAEPGLWKKFKRLFPDVVALCHSTRKHTKETPRYRLVIPFSRHVLYNEYEPISRWFSNELGMEQFDRTTHDIGRLMYFPSVSSDGEFFFDVQDDPDLTGYLDPDWVLDQYKDWQNVAEWPFANSEREQVTNVFKKLADPREKHGTVGLFCRCYNIPEVIDEYLSEVYEPVTEASGEIRYSYVEGSTVGGLIVKDDNMHAWSFHSTDPAAGHGRNPFDLVRVHKFGHLDDNSSAVADKLPSYRAMLELANKDKNVIRLRNEENLESAGIKFKKIPVPAGNAEAGPEADGEQPQQADEHDYSWMDEMDMEGSGKNAVYAPTAQNYERILDNDPRLKGKIKFNVFKGQVEILGELPWPSMQYEGSSATFWRDDDMALLRQYLGKGPYRMPASSRIADAFAYIKRKNAYHPIRDYLNGLIWDGVERLESIVIDCLGARDCAYTREVTRKWMIGAVKRVFEPGCKFENVLALTGEERKGKSTFFYNLGRNDWFTDQFDFNLLTGGNGKMAYEATQGAWIIEIAEIDNNSGRASTKAVKRFISTRVDKYRPSHEKNVVEVPRTFVFGSTSNDHEMLAADAQGNGRFWVLDILHQQPTVNVMTEMPGLVDQYWAEAMHYYLRGETPELSETGRQAAREEQKNHQSKSGIDHIIELFLEMELPENWNEMSPEERFAYSKKPKKKTGVLLSKVCAVQLWVEALGQDPTKMTKVDARKINTVLENLSCWKYSSSPMKFTYYGSQRGYRFDE